MVKKEEGNGILPKILVLSAFLCTFGGRKICSPSSGKKYQLH
jgi:hypothetical protein